MRTLGVDLAADPRRTAVCAVDWDTGAVELWPEPVDDEAIVAAVATADRAGFDVPLGWPDRFVDAVTAHHTGGGWPPADAPPPEDRLPLRFRATDRSLMTRGRRPLGVSTDLIGVAALRGVRIQHQLRDAGIDVDRSGLTGRVVETYPAAALRQWGLRSTGYKGRPSKVGDHERRQERCVGVGRGPVHRHGRSVPGSGRATGTAPARRHTEPPC